MDVTLSHHFDIIPCKDCVSVRLSNCPSIYLSIVHSPVKQTLPDLVYRSTLIRNLFSIISS